MAPSVYEYLLCRPPSIQAAVNDTLPSIYKDEDPELPDKLDRKFNSISYAKRPGHIQCWCPSTGSFLGEVPAMSNTDVDECVAKAKAAQSTWSKTTYTQRRMVLRTIQQYILSNAALITMVCSRDSGKPVVDALLGEIMTTCEKIRCINSNGEGWLKKQYRPTGPMMVHKTAYVEYVPLGVIGVIAPWNYPFHNMLNHIISGLFAGNGVVSKPSEYTSWSGVYFTKIVRAALVANGHNPDIVQTVTGFGNAGAALVKSPDVAKIIFTGSPGVGRMVMAGAAPSLKPVILELGGKDPMVFTEDVKIDAVMPMVLRGCYQNSGQNCCGIERVFCYGKLHDEFIDKAVARVKALRQGVVLKCCGNTDEVDCGAMVMDGQIAIIQALIDDAVSKGAVLHTGGKRNTGVCDYGQYYEPTVISNINKSMRIWSEEVFGPVMCVIKVPSNSDDECVNMINDCPFGLGASVYSKDKSRAVKIGERINSGMFTANDFGVNYLIQSLPFGGVKESGFDRFAGPEGLRACTTMRAMVVDRIPGVQTSIPPVIDYPISTAKGMQFGTSLCNILYNESIWEKIKAVFGIIKATQ
jgi:acyl-CoA reductase-like NAD-dependent aldehyde dehydrogenase